MSALDKAKPRQTSKQLREENARLRVIAKDLAFMARRYADHRRSYAPSLILEHQLFKEQAGKPQGT